jgi:hypothetical protein
MTTLLQSARKLRLPGVVVTAQVVPQRITPRMRSMAQKMLRAGVLTGGWQSQAKRLAVALIEATDPTVPHIRAHKGYGSTVFNASLLLNYSRMDELIEASYLMEVLRGCSSASERRHADNFKQRLRNSSIEGEYIGVGNSDNTLCAEFVAAFTDTYAPSTKARHAALAALLDGTNPIAITI